MGRVSFFRTDFCFAQIFVSRRFYADFFAQILHGFLQNNSFMEANEITYQIRGAAFRVHAALGPGLFESVYEAALKYELEKSGLMVQRQVGLPMIYKEIKFDLGFRLDLLVEQQIIVEVKSVECLNEVHFKQVMTYLRLSNKQLGLLINFNVKSLEDKISLKRIINTFS
jgi:GxxExxY protein